MGGLTESGGEEGGRDDFVGEEARPEEQRDRDDPQVAQPLVPARQKKRGGSESEVGGWALSELAKRPGGGLSWDSHVGSLVPAEQGSSRFRVQGEHSGLPVVPPSREGILK